MWAALSPLVLWLAAIAAYAYEDGMNLFQWMGRFSQVLERPFSIGWTPYTLKCMLGSLLLYGCGVALYYSSRENRRPGEEYGSAKWGNPKELNRKYMDHQHKDANIILTQRVRLGMDGYITQRNMNVLVVGGSGSGKTRFFCKPNIYSANCSYLITDPKGELLRAAGALLAAQGYEVRVFNLIDPSQSDGYNPFSYIHSEKDVLTLIDNLIKNTTPRNASSNDPFWEKAEIALDSALMLYLVSEAPLEEQNFEMLIYMIENGGAKEDDDDYQSPLDLLFEALEEDDPSQLEEVVLLLGHFAQGQGVLPLGNQLVVLFDLVLQALYLTAHLLAALQIVPEAFLLRLLLQLGQLLTGLGDTQRLLQLAQGGLQRLQFLFILVVLDNGHISSLLVPVNFLSLTIIPKNSRL